MCGVVSETLVSRKLVYREACSEGSETINSKKYNEDGFNTSDWQVFRANSQLWMDGYATDLGTVFGKIGRNPNADGKTCFGWGSIKTMLTAGVELEKEVGQ